MSERTCTIDGCSKPHEGRGLCNMHLKRLRNHGSTDDPRPSIQQRFWAKVDKSGECWLWTGAKDRHGYGSFSRKSAGGGSKLAHRVAYELLVGPIGPGLVLDHRCHEPSCVNPSHLQPVPQRLNSENRAGLAKNNSTGVRGVYWHKGARKYLVQALSGGRHYYGGLYADLLEAEAAAIALRNRVMTNNLVDRAS